MSEDTIDPPAGEALFGDELARYYKAPESGGSPKHVIGGQGLVRTLIRRMAVEGPEK